MTIYDTFTLSIYSSWLWEYSIQIVMVLTGTDVIPTSVPHISKYIQWSIHGWSLKRWNHETIPEFGEHFPLRRYPRGVVYPANFSVPRIWTKWKGKYSPLLSTSCCDYLISRWTVFRWLYSAKLWKALSLDVDGMPPVIIVDMSYPLKLDVKSLTWTYRTAFEV